MKLFKISGKFEQNKQWSRRKSDFIGYFVKREEDDVIEGYIEEQFVTSYDKIRYIKGLYMEDLSQLIFLKMINLDNLSPLVYAFADISTEGFWDGYGPYFGSFYKGHYEGHAKVEIQEITDEKEKEEHTKKVISIFEEKSSKATRINRELMKQVYVLIDLLKEPRYPKG